MSFFAELKRRNVVRATATYCALSWLVIQIVETLFPVFGVADSAVRIVVILLAIGLLPVVIFAWLFEWTPEGFKPDAEVDSGSPQRRGLQRRANVFLTVALVLATGFFAIDKFVIAC